VGEWARLPSDSAVLHYLVVALGLTGDAEKALVAAWLAAKAVTIPADNGAVRKG